MIEQFPSEFVIVVQVLSQVWLCDRMDCSMPGSPVLHYLLELIKNSTKLDMSFS